MKLDNIGFYTLSEHRALHASEKSPLYRCEMILTGRCNFDCKYCRKLDPKDIDFGLAIDILKLWIDNGLKNIRFSGGEPTLFPWLSVLVAYCKKNDVERIAISTNGSADYDFYYHLYECGVNDFSISLDACCAGDNNQMNGIDGYWDKITNNIKNLSKITYTTVGIVLDDRNIDKTKGIIELSHVLGVNDIRIIPSAQYGRRLNQIDIDSNILDNHPILNYRLENKKPVRGLNESDSPHCYLALDDMISDINGYHYPCIIYFRERGKSIGKTASNVRKNRGQWIKSHNCLKDPICKNNCLDVCRDYNNFIYKIRGIK